MQTWDAYSYRPPGSKSEYIVTFYTGLYFVTFMMETLMILPYRLKTLTLKIWSVPLQYVSLKQY